MKAALYSKFQGPISIEEVADPSLAEDAVLIEVKATGLCRSDWHGWMGHDADIHLPHVPGHELAGVIVAKGSGVSKCQLGDRVTVPFVSGCGRCEECRSGHHQVCDRQFQPGFTAWGSFAEYVAISYADENIVKLPDDMFYMTAASLGCRFITSFRAVVHQAKLAAGQSITIFGCGGVGLSAIMIAKALGAKIIAVDINDDSLALAASMGADHLINSSQEDKLASQIRDLTQGGSHVSVDALGSYETCLQSIHSLRKRGKHVQVGLMTGDHASMEVPFDKIVAHELEILGSHGMQAAKYPEMFTMIESGLLDPSRLVSRQISLAEAPAALSQMNEFRHAGMTVIDMDLP